MTCTKPIKMSTSIYSPWAITQENNNKILIKCGKCKNCKISTLGKWESRLMLEYKYLQNFPNHQIIFTTLTYNDENLFKTKKDKGTHELQKWIKRLRGKNNKNKLKYFGVYERGGQKGRIHHHIILMSENTLIEKEYGGTSINGNYYFNSKQLKWDNGFNSTTIVETETAERTKKVIKYINKYLLKNPLKYIYSKKIGYEMLDENKKVYLYNGKIYKNPKNKEIKDLKEIKAINKLQERYKHTTDINIKKPINRKIEEI